MNIADFNLNVGSMNQTYNLVSNCKVAPPPYESDGFYNDEFYLDKRDGITLTDPTNYPNNTLSGKPIIDRVKVNNIYAYLSIYNTTAYQIYHGALNQPSASAINYSSQSGTVVKKLITANGVTGGRFNLGTVTSSSAQVGGASFANIPGYNGGYVVVTLSSITATTVGNYIVFKTGILKGSVNRIEQISGNDVYIIGTNARGSLPVAGDQFSIYGSTGEVLLYASSSAINCVIFNNLTVVEEFPVLNVTGVIDICEYDGNIFVLTKNTMFFSRATFDDNIQFYPLDFYKISNGKKLFPMGKVLLVFADQNKLFAAASTTGTAVGYVGYGVKYTGELFSKDSCIFTDQSIFILQKDKRLMQVDIIQSNTTSYDLVLKDMADGSRGLFESISGGEVSMKSFDKYLKVIHRKIDGSTDIYEFDKQYKHWIVNKYPIHIYGHDTEVYGLNGFYLPTGSTDNGVDIKQEVNFSLVGNGEILMPMIIRTMVGLHSNKNDFNLDITFDLGGKREFMNFNITDLPPDQDLPSVDIGVGIPENLDTSDKGTIYSVQRNIYKSGRFINFKYSGINRFMLGRSMIAFSKMKLFINEI